MSSEIVSSDDDICSLVLVMIGPFCCDSIDREDSGVFRYWSGCSFDPSIVRSVAFDVIDQSFVWCR